MCFNEDLESFLALSRMSFLGCGVLNERSSGRGLVTAGAAPSLEAAPGRLAPSGRLPRRRIEEISSLMSAGSSMLCSRVAN